MSVEVLEAQEQLQRARDNLRHVEEGIKKTAIASNFRFDNEGGRGRPGRRLLGRLGGVQRFRADDETTDEPPPKKALSSVASRLGPLNIENKPDNDNEDDAPALKSMVTLSQNQDRETASSVVNDAKTLNRSKRLLGSLLMGTLRQFKQDKEKTKSSESKQAEMWDKIKKKEAETVARTAEDRRRLEAAKQEVNEEIKHLENKMEFAEMKVRAIEERDTYAQFIRTKTKPHIYYQPNEYTEATKKALKDSNYRVNKDYEVRIERYSNKISEIERKIAISDGGVEKQLGELNTVKIEKITRTVANDRGALEEKAHNPATGIKVEVQLRDGTGSVSDSELMNKPSNHTPSTSKSAPKLQLLPKKRSRSKSPVERKRSKSPAARKRESPRAKSIPKRRVSSPRRTRSSPRRKSRSPRGKSRSPRRRPPKKSPLKSNRKSKSVSPANRNSSKKDGDKSKTGKLPGENKDSASSKSITKSKSRSKDRSADSSSNSGSD